jgi:hypothetical protein
MRIPLNCIATALTLSAALSCRVPAQAAIVDLPRLLSDVTISANVGAAQGHGRTFFDETSLARSFNDADRGGLAQASVALSAAPRPSLTAGVAAFGSPESGQAAASVNAYMQYQFVIHGPTVGVPVLFDALGSLSVRHRPAEQIVGTNFSQAMLSMSVARTLGGPAWHNFLLVSTTPGASTFNVSRTGNVSYSQIPSFITGILDEHGTYVLETETNYTVQLQILASVSSLGTDTAYGAGLSVYTTLDPLFSVAPGTPKAELYSFTFSPGAGNGLTAAVPEPATWAMMLFGFAGLGLAGRRHARPAPAAEPV